MLPRPSIRWLAWMLTALAAGAALAQAQPPAGRERGFRNAGVPIRYKFQNRDVFHHELRVVDERHVEVITAAGEAGGAVSEDATESFYRIRYEVGALRRQGGADISAYLEEALITRAVGEQTMTAHLTPEAITYTRNGRPANPPVGAPRTFSDRPLRLSVTAQGQARLVSNPWDLTFRAAVGDTKHVQHIVTAFGQDFTNLPEKLLPPADLGSARINGTETVELPPLEGYPPQIQLPIVIDWRTRLGPLEKRGRSELVTLHSAATNRPVPAGELTVRALGGRRGDQLVRLENSHRTQSLDVTFDLTAGRTESLQAEGTYTARFRLAAPGAKSFDTELGPGVALEAFRGELRQSRLLNLRAGQRPPPLGRALIEE